MNLRDGYAEVMAAAAQAWTPPARLTVSEWADKHRILPEDVSAEGGQWRTSRNPLLREPMDALSDHHPCTQVTAMACSQDGKSEILNNWAGYSMDVAPSSFLLVQPDERAAERYNEKRVEPMIKECDALKLKCVVTKLDITFPGGFIMLTGAGSPSALASTPIKKVALDEVDKFPVNIKGQGSPVKQAQQRSITFPRYKHYCSSTPIKLPLDDVDAVGGSEIWRQYQAGSRGRYHVPCPHCGFLQELFFEHLRWEKSINEKGRKVHLVDTAVYMCQGPGCGLAIEEHHKPEMLADIPMGGQARWVHERPLLVNSHPSYHWNALYTPVGLGRTWAKIAEEWIEACRDRSKLITFWNLILGLPFDDHADRLREQDIEEQAEAYPLRLVPRGYFILTGSVDNQKDHLDFMVRAWGRNGRSVVIDRVKIWEDPAKDVAWQSLTKLRHQTFLNAFGIPLRIAMTAIDTGGHHTQKVYEYCRAYQRDSVIAVKGHSLRKQVPLGKPSRKDSKNSRGDTARNGLALWMVGTDTIKEGLFARLTDWQDDACLADPTLRSVRLTKQLGHEFFRELTAEIYNEQTGLWDKIRERNEALDLMVYSEAAACHPHVRVDRMVAADWDAIEAYLEPANGDLFATGQAPAGGTVGTEAVQTPAQPEANPPMQRPFVPVQAPAPEPALAGDSWLGETDNWLD